MAYDGERRFDGHPSRVTALESVGSAFDSSETIVETDHGDRSRPATGVVPVGETLVTANLFTNKSLKKLLVVDVVVLVCADGSI